jgi:xylulokinase
VTEDSIVLAHDLGTSGVKSSLVADGTAEIASMDSRFTTRFPKNGWAEQDPSDWWNGVIQNTKNLVAARPEIAARVRGIGVCGQMLGCVPVGADGETLAPSMIHSDSRSTHQFQLIADSIGPVEVYRTTGNILDPKSTLCKILWLKMNRPEIYRKTEKFLQSKDFIVSKLTSNIDTTDFSDASHAQLMEIRSGKYTVEILKCLEIDMAKMPSIHKGTDIAGRLTDKNAKLLGLPSGIPVIVGGGDGACASLGAGIANPGDTYLSLGTTAWIANVAPEPIIDPGGRIFNILGIDGATSGVFGTMQCAGRSIDWVQELLGCSDPAAIDGLAESVSPGSDGLVFLPYLEGERSPHFDPNARGVLFGLTPSHLSPHIARSVMEGVSFGLRSILDVFTSTSKIDRLRILGGGARSDTWRRIIADVLEVGLVRLRSDSINVTSIGTALAVAVGIGSIGSLGEAAALIEEGVEERPDSSTAEAYRKNYAIFSALYPNLKLTYASLSGGYRQ